MCILQDFEAITPNLLARTIETVEGGGLVLLLLKGMNSLKQLYTLSMDVHSRYRTEAHQDVVGRFNERFILSLGSCEACLVVDDELNVLPISGGRSVKQLPPPDPDVHGKTPSTIELQELKEEHRESVPAGPLIQLARTLDQGKALLTFMESIGAKTLQSTVTLTAARGRGKSATLGVAVAAAIAYGYSNIFITSPSPENLKTLFEFVFKGFDALDFLDHVDYTIIQSTNPDFNKAIVRVNVHRQHRQTIQYIQPQDAHVLGQAELVVIDEAAAIPLPLVRRLMGPYLVFMASTINGYEGTGRSLSLKLIQQLRDQSRGVSKAVHGDGMITDRSTGKQAKETSENSYAGRSLREITLSEPIRYNQGDAVEKWLNKLLCLDATMPKSKIGQGTPHPSQCELLYVNRDTLFSYHEVSEKFLQQMMALYVASHYKNSPNDLQLMSDAPAHHLFVLVPPVDKDAKRLPEPLCVLQVAMEGQISRESVLSSLSRGQRAGGDLIPWLVSQQFQEESFASLSGARIVRIATNPDYVSMGYGGRALQLLIDFYEGKFTNLSESEILEEETMERITDGDLEDTNLLQDNIKVRELNRMPPLFARLSERRPPQLDYVGVSYGLTAQLHKFWKRAKFSPVYLRQTANDLTGEHTCVMLRTLATTNPDTTDGTWLDAFAKDFHKRFLNLLGFNFRNFSSILAISIDESAMPSARLEAAMGEKTLTKAELRQFFSPFDLKRLEGYANNMLDHHVILDLLPTIAMLYFGGRIRATGAGYVGETANAQFKLTGVQSAILLAIGLQRKQLEDLEKELGLQVSQLLAMFVKIMRKFATLFRHIEEAEIAKDMPVPDGQDAIGSYGDRGREIPVGNEEIEERDATEAAFAKAALTIDHVQDVDEELDPERIQKRLMIDSLPLHQYQINNGNDAEWNEAERLVRKSGGEGATVSVKSSKKDKRDKDKGEKRKGAALQDAEREADRVREAGKGKRRKTGK
jgi:N-acetyltransferase 10